MKTTTCQKCSRPGTNDFRCKLCPFHFTRCDQHAGRSGSQTIATHSRWKHPGKGPHAAKARKPVAGQKLLPPRRHKLKAARASSKLPPRMTIDGFVGEVRAAMDREVARRVDEELEAKARELQQEADRIIDKRLRETLALLAPKKP